MNDKLTQRPETSVACKNEDTQLWERETQEEPFKSFASIHLTKNAEGLGICLGGYCIVMPIEKWHSMALNGPPAVNLDKVREALEGICSLKCEELAKSDRKLGIVLKVGMQIDCREALATLPPAPTDHKGGKL